MSMEKGWAGAVTLHLAATTRGPGFPQALVLGFSSATLAPSPPRDLLDDAVQEQGWTLGRADVHPSASTP